MGNRALALVLALALAGCGNVDTGIGDPTDPDASPTADPADPTPDPTPDPEDPGDLAPLTELGGLFAINRNRGSTDYTIENNFEGGGFFFPTAVGILPGLFDDFFNYGANWPDDTCKTGSGLAFSMPGQQIDAGTITLLGPNGDLPFFQLFGMMYAAANGDPGLFVPMAPYELTATGGAQISSFNVAIDSPGDLEVTSPALLSNDPFPIDRTQDLQLKWNSTKDGKPVFAMVAAGPGTSWHCKFIDDGSAAIPASVLQNFPETGYVEDNEVPELQLWKYRYTHFHPQGAAAPVLLVLESGWYIEVAFQ